MKHKFLINQSAFAFASVMVVAVLFTSCADVTPIKECVIDTPYGFLGGLWHGIILPLSFIGSLFNDDIAMYAVNNNGGWYDFGFLLGVGISFGGSTSASK
jgi:hypothetical protein